MARLPSGSNAFLSLLVFRNPKILSPCHCAVLRKASRHVSQVYDLAVAPAGLKTTQFSLLAAIHRNGEESSTMGELAEVMVMDRSTLGHNLRPLKHNGLITIETGLAMHAAGKFA